MHYLVPRVLLQVGVGIDILCGKSEEVEILGKTCTVRRMSLPVPRILAALVTAEIAIADQVGAAESFKVKLARTLIQNLVQRIAEIGRAHV